MDIRRHSCQIVGDSLIFHAPDAPIAASGEALLSMLAILIAPRTRWSGQRNGKALGGPEVIKPKKVHRGK